MADKETQDKKKQFRQLPEDRNKKEVGQGKISLAPMLHWDVSDTPSQKKEMAGENIVRETSRDLDSGGD